VDKMFPKISGDRIIWIYSDSTNESFSVQLYNTSSEEISAISDAISVPLVMPRQLAIAENNAVWSGMNPATEDVNIFLYDIASAMLQQVTEDGSGTHLDPGVSEDYVIWTNLTDESSDVYLYEIAGESTIPFVTDPFYQMETAIGGNTTAWVDNETEGGDFDVVVALFGESAGIFLGGVGDDRYPDTSSDGRYVAWISFLENQSAVYLYDVMEDNATRVTGESAFPDAVAVEGNIVVYSDLRSGNHDIYMYDIDTGNETPVTVDPYDQSYPDVSDGEIVWMGNNTGQWEIYRASAGEQDQSRIVGGPTPVPVQTPFSKSIGTPAIPSG
jgi:beta propeller repeat protein